MRGKGDGTFAEPDSINVSFNDADSVDYDHDGRVDVVLVNFWHTMVLLNRPTRGPNLSPVAIAGPDYTITYDDQFGDDDCDGVGASYDPNLDQLTFEWIDKDGRIVSTAGELCPGALPPGTHSFTLIARDAYGGQSTDSKTITVTPFKEAVVAAGYYATYGAWRTVEDATAAQGHRLWHPNAGAVKLSAPLANAVNYVDIRFLADPTQNYKLWVRMKAQNDSWSNDSIFVQFGEGALSGGRTRYEIGTTEALDVNLEQCSGCGVSGWGWRDERWGTTLTSAPVLLRFPNGGWQQMRVQTREDGVSIDQVVFSSEKYLSAPPGPPKRDNTILTPRPR